MLPTGRKPNGVIAMFLMTLHASCAGAPRPSVESYRLSETDVEVLRVAVTSAREIPDLAIAGLGNRHGADDVPAGWTVVAASAPSYPTKETAVLYAHLTCRGGGCGEGRLIRLTRVGASWRITESEQLWIG